MTRRFCALVLGPLAALLALASQGGCLFQQELDPPFVVYAPYDAPRDLVYAVAPLRNESGVSVVDELAISDELVAQLEQVIGVTTLPVNRSLEAMQALELPRITTPREARELARTLGADAIVVGTITAWDPYEPPRLGMNLAIFSGTDDRELAERTPFDLQRSPTDQRRDVATSWPLPATDEPLATASAVLDASNHMVVSRVRRYAFGRTEKGAAMGTDRWLMSMERYTEFCCFVLVEGLMDAERRRLARGQAAFAAR
ncbi:MAG: hypothetical protein AAGI30_01910 [Planctomycetota bacterium]